MTVQDRQYVRPADRPLEPGHPKWEAAVAAVNAASGYSAEPEIARSRRNSDVHLWTRGERIRKARQWAGFEHEELGRILDVSRMTISRWEHDKHPASRAHMMALQMLTGFRWQWLETGEGAPQLPETGPTQAQLDPRTLVLRIRAGALPGGLEGPAGPVGGRLLSVA